MRGKSLKGIKNERLWDEGKGWELFCSSTSIKRK
jgi:hypothetical protein